MKSSNDHIDKIFGQENVLSQDMLEKYLNGELSPQEMHEVERIMIENDIYDDALEGLELMRNNPAQHSKNLLDIKAAVPGIVGVQETKHRKLWPIAGGIAASIALIIGLVFIFSKEEQTNATAHYSSEDVGSTSKKQTEAEEEIAIKNTDKSLKQKEEKETVPEANDAAMSYEQSKPIVRESGNEKDEVVPLAEGIADVQVMEAEEETEPGESTEELEVAEKSAIEKESLNDNFRLEEEKTSYFDAQTESSKGFLNNKNTEYKSVIDYEALSQEMLSLSDPAVVAMVESNEDSKNVIPIDKSELRKGGNNGGRKRRKTSVSQPNYRNDSYQARSQNKKDHSGKKKTADDIAGRQGPNLLEDADHKFAIGNYSQAASLYELVLQQQPSNAGVLYNTGVSYIKTNQPKLAIKKLSKIKNDKKLGSEATWYLVIAYLKNQNEEKAKSLLKELSTDKTFGEDAKTMLAKLQQN